MKKLLVIYILLINQNAYSLTCKEALTTDLSANVFQFLGSSKLKNWVDRKSAAASAFLKLESDPKFDAYTNIQAKAAIRDTLATPIGLVSFNKGQTLALAKMHFSAAQRVDWGFKKGDHFAEIETVDALFAQIKPSQSFGEVIDYFQGKMPSSLLDKVIGLLMAVDLGAAPQVPNNKAKQFRKILDQLKASEEAVLQEAYAVLSQLTVAPVINSIQDLALMPLDQAITLARFKGLAKVFSPSEAPVVIGDMFAQGLTEAKSDVLSDWQEGILGGEIALTSALRLANIEVITVKGKIFGWIVVIVADAKDTGANSQEPLLIQTRRFIAPDGSVERVYLPDFETTY